MKDFTAGKYLKQRGFSSFIPSEINRQWIIENPGILSLLSQADRQLGRLDMYSEYDPNIDLFIRMHVLKEATQSSKIEGTKTNIEEALQKKEELSEEKKDDWEEVQNYLKAMESSIESLDKLPLSSRLIKHTHHSIMQGVRGEHKSPGKYRTSQNWIGGASLADAVFIPPPHTEISRLMGDLEKFANDESNYCPELLKIALIHYQFETIHPFLDGNGRVGRLLITLYLVEKKILKQPILYLSDFFERNRDLYYDNLMKVRLKDDIVQWFKFFLVGVIETAKSSINTFSRVVSLQKEVDEKLQSLGSRAYNARKVLNYLYKQPLLNVNKVAEICEMSLPSSYKIVGDLEKLKILKEKTGAKRGKQYLFAEYLDLYK